jgi:peptidoglycan/LPS O-acetylase OafA/YrhL
MFVLYLFKPAHWYNTMLVFPAGVTYALYADKLERLIQKKYGLVVLTLIAVFFLIHLFMGMHPLHGLTFNVKSIVFALLIVVLTMKFRIGNRWLYWCGASLFPLFIYQRVPMLSMRAIAGNEWICEHPNVFIIVCFVITVGITLLYNKYFRLKLV